MTLTDALQSYLAIHPSLGPKPADETQRLARRLERVSRDNRRYFAVCFGAVGVLFVGAAAVAAMYLRSPTHITAVFGALGITVTGLIRQMTQLWKDKVAADMLLVLVAVADGPQMKKIVERLLKRF
jgi:hypothetical protein